jgi:cold shock CspA family protein
VRIHAGQSHGFILAADSRQVFFHRSDTSWGTFNTLLVGDAVAFELIEDRVSGPRATAVRREEASPDERPASPGLSTPDRREARGVTEGV